MEITPFMQRNSSSIIHDPRVPYLAARLDCHEECGFPIVQETSLAWQRGSGMQQEWGENVLHDQYFRPDAGQFHKRDLI